MNDEQILFAGGDENDVRQYAEEHGANLAREDVANEEILKECQSLFVSEEITIFVKEALEAKDLEHKKAFQEVLNRITYFYMKTDGIYEFPNSAEGDLLKMIFELLKP
jgi:hypothetical protein